MGTARTRAAGGDNKACAGAHDFRQQLLQRPVSGIPEGGYNRLIDALLEGTETILQLDFFSRRDELCSLADKIVFTGRIDKYFDYRAGRLEYRSLKFDTKVIDTPNFQGNAW